MTKRTIRIGYADMGSDFNESDNYIATILSETYDVVIDNDQPDILVYSIFGYSHLLYEKPLMLYCAGENIQPNFTSCDYALSFLRDSIGGRNNYHNLTTCEAYMPSMPSDEEALHRRFAIFIASQDSMGRGAALRKLFTQRLMEQYKHVDCPGKVLHNVDIPDLSARQSNDWSASKLPVLNRYKFNIAFENSNTDGYITEKLSDAFRACTVPIYWGSEGNPAPFPREAMICANDYPNIDALIARVREVDENDALYLSILRANPLYIDAFQQKIAAMEAEKKEFLHRVAEKALARQTMQEDDLQKGCRCQPQFTLSYLLRKSFCSCPMISNKGLLHSFMQNMTHLYFLRPGAVRKKCLFGNLFSKKSSGK